MTKTEIELLILDLIEKNPKWNPDEVLYMADYIISLRESDDTH